SRPSYLPYQPSLAGRPSSCRAFDRPCDQPSSPALPHPWPPACQRVGRPAPACPSACHAGQQHSRLPLSSAKRAGKPQLRVDSSCDSPELTSQKLLSHPVADAVGEGSLASHLT